MIARVAFGAAIPPQWESNPRDITFEGRLEGDRITGSMTMGDGQTVTWSGTRAPSLRRAGPPAWGAPVTLFNSKSIDGWQPVGRGESQWGAVGGILQNAKSGANLVTVQRFADFKLHLDVKLAARARVTAASSLDVEDGLKQVTTRPSGLRSTPPPPALKRRALRPPATESWSCR